MNKDRTENSFYAVWKPGMEWPEWFADRSMADARVKHLALQNPGTKVHLLNAEPVGSAEMPADALVTTGCI